MASFTVSIHYDFSIFSGASCMSIVMCKFSFFLQSLGMYFVIKFLSIAADFGLLLFESIEMVHNARWLGMPHFCDKLL